MASLRGEVATVPMGTTLGKRLELARNATGMSTRAVAAEIKRRFPQSAVSHATIANFEKGRSSPSIQMLGILAEIYQRPLAWFLQVGPALTGVQYRNLKSKVRVADRHCFESNAQRWLEAYIRIEQRLGRPLTPKAPVLEPRSSETATEFAMRVRQEFAYSDQPIPSIVELLERFGIRVLELPTELAIDGLAAKFGRERVVVLNPNVPHDRSRMNAAHELAHVLYRDSDEDLPRKAVEARAFEFASNLLLPNSQLKAAFQGRSVVRLVQFKERFGISLAAMVYRAEKTGIIQKDVARRLWIAFARRGWRTSEPGHVRPDRATRFEQLLDTALFQRKLTYKESAQLAGASIQEIRSRLRLAMGRRPDDQAESNEAMILTFPSK